MKINPVRTALLAVHLQRDIAGEAGGLTQMFREQVVLRDVVAKSKYLIDYARNLGSEIIFTRVAFDHDYQNMHANSPLLLGTRETGSLKDGSNGAEIVAALSPQDGDKILTHQRIGAFAGTQLHQNLQEREITTLVVFGVATNASVETNVRWASDLGYDVVLVEDCCSSTDFEAHQAAVASLGMMSTVATSPEVIEALASAL